ncbi:MAG: mechanosensitive ion channel family protein [Anaerolineales bacterium]|nr:mechanosensitive ion channel family protein [Anaerolineales bacterium]
MYRKLILSVLVLLTQATIRRLSLHLATNRISDDSPHLYTIRKVTGYLITILATVTLFGIWVQRLGDLSVALGILAAGLAFALQEVIGSIAGWITIVFGRPFSIGDRVETGGIRGDVVDVSVLRTTLMEIGNWLGGDHNTGRIVTLSNAFLFKEPLFNYSAHLRYLWDEIVIPVTYTSDWQRAVEILLNAARDHAAYQELLPKAEQQRRQARKKLAVRITPLEPRVFVKLTDNWIELGLVYPVDTDLRRSFRNEISQQILVEFDKIGIVIASQTVSIVRS